MNISFPDKFSFPWYGFQFFCKWNVLCCTSFNMFTSKYIMISVECHLQLISKWFGRLGWVILVKTNFDGDVLINSCQISPLLKCCIRHQGYWDIWAPLAKFYHFLFLFSDFTQWCSFEKCPRVIYPPFTKQLVVWGALFTNIYNSVDSIRWEE